jgi:hypothetical protein
MATEKDFAEWLVLNGYPIDWKTAIPAPVSKEALAKACQDNDPFRSEDETVEDYVEMLGWYL